MSLVYSNIFEEIENPTEKAVQENAEKYLEDQRTLQYENYHFYEKHQQFLKDTQDKFMQYLRKIQLRLDRLDRNFKNFENCMKEEKFITNQFVKMPIADLITLPPDCPTLPKWFEGYKEEEFEKLKPILNKYGTRVYGNMMSEHNKTQRKELSKKIRKFIEELQVQYTEDTKIPIIKINDLQKCLRELQYLDGVIPEVSVQIMKQAKEYAHIILRQFIEFRQRCNEHFYQKSY